MSGSEHNRRRGWLRRRVAAAQPAEQPDRGEHEQEEKHPAHRLRVLLVTLTVIGALVGLSAHGGAFTSSYHYNPIPVVNGRQYGWSLTGNNSWVRTQVGSQSGFFCGSCYRFARLKTNTGVYRSTYQYGAQGYVYVYPPAGTYPVAAWHEVKFKDSGVCYASGRQVGIDGSVVSSWLVRVVC